MKRSFLLLASIGFCFGCMAQPETFDIASFIPPKGWQRTDSNGAVLFQDMKTKDGMMTGFCQIFLYPSRSAGNDPAKNFKAEWDGRVAATTGSKEKPKTATEKTPDGWTVVTGHANITQQGISYTTMLVSASGFSKVMSVMINMAGADYSVELDSFFTHFELDAKATITPQNNFVGGLDSYSFISPEGWRRHPAPGQILLSAYQSPEAGCIISIYPPQTTTGNLEKDAWNIFNDLYKGGWQYRFTNERQYDLSKGHTLQGLEFCRLEASMQKDRGNNYWFDYEKGDILVVNLGKQVAVVVARHERGESTCWCSYRYDFWNRFFNSFTVKNAAPQKHTNDIAKRIVGSWQSMGGNALNKYIFAANNRYQFIGAYSTTSRIDRYTIELRTSGFKGDGKYMLKEGKIVMTKDGSSAETSWFRMEKINHGGKGWTDRIYLRTNSGSDGKEYEVCLERQPMDN